MGGKPNNVTRLEVELCEHGFRNNGSSFSPLDPTANDEGHFHYKEVLTMSFGDTGFDFCDRYSTKAVRMYGHATPETLEVIAQTLKDNHKNKRETIQVEVIVSVSTAVAVCEALRGHHG